jgi:hypothetical protein
MRSCMSLTSRYTVQYMYDEIQQARESKAVSASHTRLHMCDLRRRGLHARPVELVRLLLVYTRPCRRFHQDVRLW